MGFLSGIWGRIAVFGGAILALAGIVLGAFLRGRSGAKKEDAAKAQAVRDREVVQTAEMERQTQDDAVAAVAAVDARQKKQAAPDTDQREDLNDTF